MYMIYTCYLKVLYQILTKLTSQHSSIPSFYFWHFGHLTIASHLSSLMDHRYQIKTWFGLLELLESSWSVLLYSIWTKLVVDQLFELLLVHASPKDLRHAYWQVQRLETYHLASIKSGMPDFSLDLLNQTCIIALLQSPHFSIHFTKLVSLPYFSLPKCSNVYIFQFGKIIINYSQK